MLSGGRSITTLLLDYHMPDMDGLEVCRQIRSNSAFDNIKIIVLTSSDTSNLKPNIIPLNISGYTSKPVTSKKLYDLLVKANQNINSNLPSSIQSKPANSGIRILLADDEETNLKSTKILLEKHGYNVVTVHNGLEAVHAFHNLDFDIILMDIEMPKLNGREAAVAIRTSDKGRNIPIIALTAYATKGEKNRCLEAGMNEYLSKPFLPSVLYSLIDKMTGLQTNNGGD